MMASKASQSRGLAAPAVDDQPGRVLGDLGVEVVHEHAHGGLGLPGLAGRIRGRAARRGWGDGRHRGVSLGGVVGGHEEMRSSSFVQRWFTLGVVWLGGELALASGNKPALAGGG